MRVARAARLLYMASRVPHVARAGLYCFSCFFFQGAIRHVSDVAAAVTVFNATPTDVDNGFRFCSFRLVWIILCRAPEGIKVSKHNILLQVSRES